jgi:hypothetical protein
LPGAPPARGASSTRAATLGLNWPGSVRNHRTKKNPNEWFGFNPPKEEVEETAEVAELLQPMELII